MRIQEAQKHTDPYPEHWYPRIRILLFSSMAFKMPKRSLFLLLTLPTFTSVFKEKRLFRSLKTEKFMDLLNFYLFCWWKDPDPGGSKTCANLHAAKSTLDDTVYASPAVDIQFPCWNRKELNADLFLHFSTSVKPVVWTGIILMPIRVQIRIRLSILMPIQIWIRVIPQVLHILENPIFFTFTYRIASLHDRQCHKCHTTGNFQYFLTVYWIFL